jgi:competence protein ComEA
MKHLIAVLLAVFMLTASLPAVAAEKAPADARAAVININLASADQIQTLPGIGQVTAERIVAYRSEHGAFTKVDDLVQVKGVGEKTLEKIRNMIALK